MKDSYYFSHDATCRKDPKMSALLMKHGNEGIGIFWGIIEILRCEKGFRLHKNDYDAIAFQLHCERNALASVIENFKLFQFDDEGHFFSPSLLHRMNIAKLKSDKARKSANARWKDANAMLPECERNAIKERKGKESKLKYIYIEPHSDWYRQLKKDYPDINVDAEYKKCMLWLKDNRRKDHKRTFRNWLNNAKPEKKPNTPRGFEEVLNA